MRKRKKVPSIIILAFMTILTIFSWIFFEVYRVLISKTDLQIPEDILKPFSSSIDIETVKLLKDRTYYDHEYLVNTLPKPTLQITTQTISPDIEPTGLPIEEATISGEILDEL